MKGTVFLLILLFLFSCKKPENRTCFKSTGKQTEKVIELTDFNRLVLYEHLSYILIQDSTNQIIVKGGSHLVGKVSVELNDLSVTIKNNNRCNFLRDFAKKIVIEIHFTSLINIEITGTETLTNQGQLNFEFLSLTQREAAGSVNLNLKAKVLKSNIEGGSGDFTYSGNVDFALFNVNGTGFCNTYDLNIKDSIGVITNSTSPVKVNTSEAKFRYEIKRNGDLYYKGSPSSIVSANYGTGKVIHL